MLHRILFELKFDAGDTSAITTSRYQNKLILPGQIPGSGAVDAVADRGFDVVFSVANAKFLIEERNFATKSFLILVQNLHCFSSKYSGDGFFNRNFEHIIKFTE